MREIEEIQILTSNYQILSETEQDKFSVTKLFKKNETIELPGYTHDFFKVGENFTLLKI